MEINTALCLNASGCIIFVVHLCTTGLKGVEITEDLYSTLHDNIKIGIFIGGL